MTSVIEKLRKISDLHRLRSAVKRAPTPAAFADLAERYIALGKNRDARSIAVRGLDQFPNSERLNSICTYLRRDTLKDEINALRKQTAENPGPAVFIRLAQCYLELGDHDRTLAVCDECANRYPLNENPYLVAGEVHTQRFFLHHSENDGIEGEALLRRALRLNSQNLKARLLLAQIYYAVGAMEYLDLELAEIRRLSGDYEDLMVFRASLAGPGSAAEPAPGAPNRSMADRIRSIADQGEFVNPPWRFPACALTAPGKAGRANALLDHEQVARNVVDLAKQRGITNVTAIGPDGTTLAVAGDPAVFSVDDFPLLMGEILNTAADATRRMEFGALDWCTLEGDFGGLAINQLRGVSVGVSYGRPMKVGTARQIVGEFAARSFTANGEA